jgi:hypothetical protein
MYLELLRNDFTGTGTIAEIMDKMWCSQYHIVSV